MKQKKVKVRKDWGELNPVTRVTPMKKFTRTTEKQKWKKQIYEGDE